MKKLTALTVLSTLALTACSSYVPGGYVYQVTTRDKGTAIYTAGQPYPTTNVVTKFEIPTTKQPVVAANLCPYTAGGKGLPVYIKSYTASIRIDDPNAFVQNNDGDIEDLTSRASAVLAGAVQNAVQQSPDTTKIRSVEQQLIHPKVNEIWEQSDLGSYTTLLDQAIPNYEDVPEAMNGCGIKLALNNYDAIRRYAVQYASVNGTDIESEQANLENRLKAEYDRIRAEIREENQNLTEQELAKRTNELYERFLESQNRPNTVVVPNQ